MVEPLTPSTARTPTARTPWWTLLLLGFLALGFVLWLSPHGVGSGPRWFQSNRGIAEAQMAYLEFAIRNYRNGRGRLPATLEVLTVVTPPDTEPWLSAIPKDPWGQAYEYRIDGDRFTLRSSGEDGQPDTDDDVRLPRRE